MKVALKIMNEDFDIIESPYSLRNKLRFKSRNICTVRYGIKTAAFVGSRVWSYIPRKSKVGMSLNVFSSKIISIYSQILLYILLYLFACLFCWVFFLFIFAFILSFALFPLFPFNPQFKVELNQPPIPDIWSLIYFLLICIFYWSIINK